MRSSSGRYGWPLCSGVTFDNSATERRVRYHLVTAAVLFPAGLAAQLPRLEPLPIAPALAVLQFQVPIHSHEILDLQPGIVLIDEGTSQLVRINVVTGAEERVGREGSGPGEFRGPGPIAARPDGSVLVADFRLQRITVVTPDWKAGPSYPAGMQIQEFYRPTRDSVLTLGGTHGRDLVSLSLRDGGTSTRFAPLAADSTNAFHSDFHDQTAFWLVSRHGGGWYLASGFAYRIFILDERGVKHAGFGRDIPPEPMSAPERLQDSIFMRRANPQLSPASLTRFLDQQAAQFRIAIPAPPVEDAAGRLWVTTYRLRQDSTEIDVFDLQQRFLGTLRMPGQVRGLATRGDELVALVDYVGGERDGYQGVLRYRIR